jgi:hypothetical protein
MEDWGEKRMGKRGGGGREWEREAPGHARLPQKICLISIVHLIFSLDND